MLDDLAVRPHPHGGADDTFGDLAVHFFFAEGLVCFHYFFLRITQKFKRNTELLNKALVGGLTVRRDAQNYDIKFLEFAIYLTESLGFLGSPGCIVFGIKVNDDMLAFEILQ